MRRSFLGLSAFASHAVLAFAIACTGCAVDTAPSSPEVLETGIRQGGSIGVVDEGAASAAPSAPQTPGPSDAPGFVKPLTDVKTASTANLSNDSDGTGVEPVPEPWKPPPPGSDNNGTSETHSSGADVSALVVNSQKHDGK